MRLSERHERVLGPYLIALYVEAGFLATWPLEWTKYGVRQLKEAD